MAKHLFYIHGLGPHSAGWSTAWQAAVAPWTPSVPAANVHEVLYADVFQHHAMADREWVSLADPDLIQLASVDNRWLREIRRYFSSSVLHAETLSRFTSVLSPLLDAGDTVYVLAHSWGGVVTYEAMFQLSPGMPGSVVLFTMGCPLHFRMVRRLVQPSDHAAWVPYVHSWINLQVAEDIVGGALKQFGFPVDEDDTGLPILVTPIPTSRHDIHETYKSPLELNIQRDVIGKTVEV